MVKTSKGLQTAVVNFVVVGVVFPYLIESFSPQVSSYVSLPARSEIWAVLLLIGTMFAVTGFLQSAYSKGDFPWLFGKLASGVVSLALYLFLYSLLPSSLGSTGVQASDLLYLIVLAVVLQYGYLVFDFWDARRRRAALKQFVTGAPPQAGGAVT